MTEDTRTRILRLVRADPTISAAELGRLVKLTRSRVQQILKAAGYYRYGEWRCHGPPPDHESFVEIRNRGLIYLRGRLKKRVKSSVARRPSPEQEET